MISLAIAAGAYVFSVLAGIAIRAHSFFSDASTPRVPSFFAGYDNGLLYALNPREFLARCQNQYGPVYQVSIGYWRLKVFSTGDTISSIFSTGTDLLHYDITHRVTFNVIAGVTSSFTHLHAVMIHNLFPIVDKTLSPRSLGQTTHAFGLELLSRIRKFSQDHTGPVSITELTHKPLYAATNLILLGGAFPSDTYKDFRTVSRSIPYRFGRTLLWRWPSYAARKRLLNAFKGYLEQGDVITNSDCNLKFSHLFMKAFKDNNIQSMEGAQLVLNFLWGVHTNTLNNSLFLLSFLLGDPSAFARVRTEIDLAVDKFGGLETLLKAGPDGLDDPSFALLTSAVMETLRLTLLHIGIRQASRDFDLKAKDGIIPVKKGVFVFGNARAAHMDATVYPDPETFVVDRFAQRPYARKHLQTEGYLFHSFGGGRHICKGRWLAMYQIKTLMIILLHGFDFRPAGDNSTGWSTLRVHPRSIGVVHTEDDVFVHLFPREVKEN